MRQQRFSNLSAGTKCIYFVFSRVKIFLLDSRGSDIYTHCLSCDKRKCVLHDSCSTVGKNEDVQLCVIWNEVRSYRNSVWGLRRSVYMEPMKMTEGLRWFNILICFRSSLCSQQKSTGSLCEQLRSSRTNPRPCFSHLGWGMRTGDRIFHEEHIPDKMLCCYSCRFTISDSNQGRATQRWDFESSLNITNYFHFREPKVLIQNSRKSHSSLAGAYMLNYKECPECNAIGLSIQKAKYNVWKWHLRAAKLQEQKG